MLFVEQACGRLVVLAGGGWGGGYLVLSVTPNLGGCITSVGGCLISGGNSKLFFGFFFCFAASASSHSPSSVHSGAKEPNSAALLSGQSHLGSSRSRPSVMKEQNQPPPYRIPSKILERQQSVCKYHRRLGASCSPNAIRDDHPVVTAQIATIQRAGASKPRCSFNTTKTLQSDFSLVQNHQHLCLLSVFCFRSDVKCRSAPESSGN